MTRHKVSQNQRHARNDPAQPYTEKMSSRQSDANSYPPWAPRFWNGMSVTAYAKLLFENRFRIHPTRWPMTTLVSFCTAFNSTFGGIQAVVHGRKIAGTTLQGPPVFILGHWRSGTTLMHELMSLDDRLAFPSNFDAFAPQHMLVSRHLFRPVMNLLMPKKRPMDNMSLDADSPQEDDFALLSLGAPTPYRRVAFPNNGGDDHRFLDARELGQPMTDRLHDSLEYFLRVLTLQYQKRLVLKSPPHTGRIGLLAKWFPGAKFVHVARNPEKLVPSTMRLWKLLDRVQAHQVPRYDDAWLLNYVFECQQRMYDGYFAERGSLTDSQLIEIRFEELVKNPVAQVRQIYAQLELGDSSQVLTAVESYFSGQEYRPNKHSIDEALSRETRENWARYIDEFGY